MKRSGSVVQHCGGAGSVLGQIAELDAVVGENNFNLVGDLGNRCFEEGARTSAMSIWKKPIG